MAEKIMVDKGTEWNMVADVLNIIQMTSVFNQVCWILLCVSCVTVNVFSSSTDLTSTQQMCVVFENLISVKKDEICKRIITWTNLFSAIYSNYLSGISERYNGSG